MACVKPQYRTIKIGRYPSTTPLIHSVMLKTVALEPSIAPHHDIHLALERAREALESVILGKPETVRLATACLLAGGHLLIEDLPGMGKTLLSHALARVMGLEYARVQFTSDLLPSDILGASIFDRERGEFRFVPGAVFTQVLLADEINRAPPKSQSALLEAMEEQQVSIEGRSHTLPEPFFVIATQNPSFQSGTFALPESQLDRFLLRVQMGYPHAEVERQLLSGGDQRSLLSQISPQLSLAQLRLAQQAVQQVSASAALIDYVQRLLQHSRDDAALAPGLSPRAGLALLRAAKAWALQEQRSHVIPEDIHAVLGAVAVHRLRREHSDAEAIVERLRSVDVHG